MNSIGNILTNFEWAYKGPISIIRGTGYQGKGVSRTLFLNTPKLEDIPEQLFAVKVSQSTNPAKAGKVVFRFFSFRFDPNQKFENMAPTGIDMNTPLSEIKAIIITKLGNIPQAEASINVNLKGRFTNVECSDGLFAIYDETKPEFQSDDPTKSGDAPYYIKSDAVIQVKLKGAVSQGNEYLQSTLSTTATAAETFQSRQVGSVWDPSGNASVTAPVSTPVGAPEVPQAGQPVW